MPAQGPTSGLGFDVQSHIAELEGRLKESERSRAALANVLLVSPGDAEWQKQLLTRAEPGAASEGATDESVSEDAGDASPPPSLTEPPRPDAAACRELLLADMDARARHGAEALRTQLAAERRRRVAERSRSRAAARARLGVLTGRPHGSRADAAPSPALASAQEAEAARLRASAAAFDTVLQVAEEQRNQGRRRQLAEAAADAAQAAAAQAEAERDAALSARAQAEQGLQRLQGEHEELQGALQKAKEYGLRRNQDCEQLERRCAELDSQLHDALRQVERIRTDLEVQESRYRRLEDRQDAARADAVRGAEAEVERLQKELEARSDTQRRTEELLHATTQEKEAALQEVRRLEQQAQAERTAVEFRSQHEVAQQTARGEAAEREAQVYRQAAREKHAEVDQLREKLDATANMHSHELATLRAELAAAVARCEEASHGRAEAEQRIAALTEEARSAHQYQGEIAVLKERCAELDDRVQGLLKQNTRLEFEAQRGRASEAEAAELRAQLEAVQQAIEKANEAAGQTRDEAVATDARCEELAGQLEDAQSRVRAAEEERRELQEQLRATQAQLAEREELIRELERERDDYQDKVHEWSRYDEDREEAIAQIEEWENGVEQASFERMIEEGSGQVGDAVSQVLESSSTALKRWREYLEGCKDTQFLDYREAAVLLRTLCKNAQLRVSLNDYSLHLVKMQREQQELKEEFLKLQQQQQAAAEAPAAQAAASSGRRSSAARGFMGILRR